MKNILVLILLATVSLPSFAVDKIPADPRATQLVNELLVALSIPDADARLQAVLPLVHKSLKTSDGRDLVRSIKDYSYRRACSGVAFYAIPVQIYEVHRGNVVTVGFRETAETGRRDKYFVNKKDGQAGRPAPIHVFVPSDGGAPTIIDFGSL
jgi:hypothetical protein